MRLAIVVLALLLGAAGAAEARCADDMKDLQARVERAQKRNPPSPQAMAAAKEMAKVTENLRDMDEVDCYNAVTRIRRTLDAPPPPEQKAEQ